MNHIFVKGSVLGVEPQDIENKMVTPLSRPFKQSDQDKAFGSNSFYNSITPSHIPKQSFLNPSALDFNLLRSSNFMEGISSNEVKFNKTSDFQHILKEMNNKQPNRSSFANVKLN
jgi:hypothetical protein